MRLQAEPGPRRARLDWNSKCGQNIRAATPAGNGTIAVFYDGHPCPGDHDRNGRADIEGARAVATRAAGIEHRPRPLLSSRIIDLAATSTAVAIAEAASPFIRRYLQHGRRFAFVEVARSPIRYRLANQVVGQIAVFE